MTEDNRMPNFWWCPTHHLYRGGEKRPCADAVRLVPAPPAPRVFLPNDRVPVGTVITGKNGSPFRVPDVYAADGLAGVGVPFVEVFVPSPEEWQAAVDRADAARTTAELQQAEGTSP